MRRISIIVTVALTALVLSTAAFAGNPHFVANGTSATISGNNLIVTFKEAGLASGTTYVYNASANATATYTCVNGGGNVPADPKKTTVAGPVGGSTEVTSGKSGNITGSITLSPPGPGAFSCPGGQTATLSGVSYTTVAITSSSGSTTTISGTFPAP